MPPKITQREKQYDDRLEEAKFGSLRVKVGFPKGKQNPYPDGTSVIEVAVKNEFGEGRIPERPFFRNSMRFNRKKYIEINQKLLTKVAAGQMTTEVALETLATVAVGDVQDEIVNLREPPNAPMTIRLKGSDNPLIDTGHMRQSVTYELTND